MLYGKLAKCVSRCRASEEGAEVMSLKVTPMLFFAVYVNDGGHRINGISPLGCCVEVSKDTIFVVLVTTQLLLKFPLQFCSSAPFGRLWFAERQLFK